VLLGVLDLVSVKQRVPPYGGDFMGLILLIIVVLLIFGGLPRWNYSRNWGYGPTGSLTLVLIILLILVLMGYIPRGF